MIRIAALLTALGLVAGGCASRSDPQAQNLVWAVGAIDAREGPAHDIAAMWNERHPNGPTVRVEALPESADEQRKLMAIELEAKLEGLDILTLDVPWTAEFARNGWLVNLADRRARIEKVSLRGPLQSATWSGKLWAAPYTTNAGFLYYRTDLVTTPPKNWDELVRVGREAAEGAGIAPFVGQGAQYEGMVLQYLEHLWGAGGELFTKDGTAVDYEQGPALRALEFMAQASRDGFYAPGFSGMREEDARHVFQSGGAVFMRNWPYAYQTMNGSDSKVAGRFGIAPLPTFGEDGTVSALGGQNLGVSRFSANVGGAKEFVEFASTAAAVQRHLAERHSVPPAMASVYSDLADNPVMALLGQVLPEAKPRPAVPDWSTISDEIQQAVFPAYTGQRDPRRSVEDIRGFLKLTVSRS